METFQTRDRATSSTAPLPYVVRRGRDFLAKLLAENGFNKGVEVGVRDGNYSAELCKANPNIELYCIDPWVKYGRYSQESQDIHYENARSKLVSYNVTLIRNYSTKAVAEFPYRTLDFVFIDGNHTFDHCMQDLIMWGRRVRRGGIISVHDYSSIPGDVGTAVNAYTHGHRIDPWYMTREINSTAFWVKT